MDRNFPRPLVFEAWMARLKAAYDAGYYRTEAAEGEQTRFPWQDRTCGDCPFWSRNTCLVREARRGRRHLQILRPLEPSRGGVDYPVQPHPFHLPGR